MKKLFGLMSFIKYIYGLHQCNIQLWGVFAWLLRFLQLRDKVMVMGVL